MKKLLLLITILALTFSVYAQKPEEIKVSTLPKNITLWITQNLKKPTMERAAKIMDNKKLLGYCVVVATDRRKMIFVFDKNGNYIEKIKKMEEMRGLLKPAQPVKK